MFTKAFRFHDVKMLDGDGRFTGRASVYGVVDLQGEVVMPGAFTKTLAENGGRVKVLNQHNPYDVIGLAQLEDREDALWVAEGKLSLGLASAQEAHVRLKDGLIDGLSIGYEVIKEKFDKGVRQLTEVKLWEVSLVTFPANPLARVTNVKGRLDELVENAAAFVNELKAGRVLSAANQRTIEDAYAALLAAAEALRRVLEAARKPEDDTGKGNVTPPVAAKVAEGEADVPPSAEPDVFHSLRTVERLFAEMRDALNQTTKE